MKKWSKKKKGVVIAAGVALLGLAGTYGYQVSVYQNHVLPGTRINELNCGKMTAKEADIVIVAAGRAGVVGAEYVREGQTIIDVGINVNAEGKLCGDVDYAAVEPIVDAITPVPGGVGSVTTSVLVGHVVEAAMRKVNG